MSLMSALNAAVSGLRTTQAGINLVSQNVANADSIGYTRKTLSPVQTLNGANSAGVKAGAVQRILDTLVQKQLRNETSGAAYTKTRAEFATALDRLFGAPGASSSLDGAMNAFNESLSMLANDPGNFAARAAVLDAAQTLAARIGSAAQGVQQLRTQAEGRIDAAVTRANELLSGIAETNRKITAESFRGGSAALEDERDRMIGELSALMDIEVEPGQNGSVTIRTGTGATLFDGVNATRLTFDRRPALDAGMAYDQANSSVGVIRAVSVAGASFDLVAGGAFRSGEIAAALEMRDAILPQAQRQLDELAAGLSRAFSDAPGTIDNATNTITFDANFTNQPVTVDLVIGGQFQRFSVAQPATRADLEAAITGAGFAGVTVTDPGGGEWRINGLPAQSAVLGASYTVTGTGAGAAPFPLFVDRAAANAPFTGVGGQLTGFAQRLAVNPAVVADRSLLVRMDGTTPQGDPTRPLAALNALTSGRQVFAPQAGIGGVSAPFTGSVADFGRRIVEMQGAAAQAAQRLDEGQRIALATVESRFAETSAVNIDQEMAQLLQLQTAYGANARVMTAVRDMMDMLMRI